MLSNFVSRFVVLKYILKGDVKMLVRLFSIEIIRGRITFNDVPKQMKNSVKAYLADLGLDENGKPFEKEEEVK